LLFGEFISLFDLPEQGIDSSEEAWLAEITPYVDFDRPVQFLVKKRLKNGKFVYSYYVSTLTLPSKARFMRYYQERGAAEVEQFRNDKGGLFLAARRKRSFGVQKALILLTDLAHNLLADFHHQALSASPLPPLASNVLCVISYKFLGAWFLSKHNSNALICSLRIPMPNQ
jgi:hypothetical protein